MTFWFVLGTAAELIKMYPVILECEKRGKNWFALNSGQSPSNLSKQWHDLKLPSEKLLTTVASLQDLSNSRSALKWFFRALFFSKSNFQKIKFGANDIIFVHGDTLTTLVGAIWAKKLGLRLAHVEAGMRSGHILEPFPEEICRRIVSRMTSFHFAPDEYAANNLKNENQSGLIISTQANTLLDAIRIVIDRFPPPPESMKSKVLVNLHRFENLNSSNRWKQMIDIVRKFSKTYKLVFVMHPPTKHRLDQAPGLQTELETLGIEFKQRVPFSEFSHWLKQCSFLITDGGSNQEEASYLGIPCLILREKTERREGLGGNCVLSKFDPQVVENFFRDPFQFSKEPVAGNIHPAKIILDLLETHEGNL